MSEFFMRYVAHAQVSDFEALGWRNVGSGRMADTNHGLYSTLMRWDGAGPPPAPNDETRHERAIRSACEHDAEEAA